MSATEMEGAGHEGAQIYSPEGPMVARPRGEMGLKRDGSKHGRDL